MNKGIKDMLSQSKLSQRSNSSRVSDRSRASSRKGDKPVLKKRDNIKMQIKTTNIQQVPDKDLKGFKGMFFGSRTTDIKEVERKSISINTHRKSEIYSRPRRESAGNTIESAYENTDKNQGMGGLLHRIAE